MKCLYCNKTIDGRYVEDRYGNVCCASHIDNNEVGVCGECLKLVPIQGNKLPDGRIVCPECMKIAVTPSRPYDWIEKQVLARLQNWGFGDLDMSRITIWTATSKEMAMYRKKDINVFNEGFCRLFPETMKVDLFVEFSFSGICFVYRLFDLANAGIAVFFPFKVGRNHNCQIHRDQEFCGSVYQRPVF